MVPDLSDDTIVARIEHDYLADDDNASRVGTQWTIGSVQQAVNILGERHSYESVTLGGRVEFQLLDDDENAYYAGWLIDDTECITQIVLLEWGMSDSGTTIIEVKRNGKWVREIG
jgi:hypothetical protein